MKHWGRRLLRLRRRSTALRWKIKEETRSTPSRNRLWHAMNQPVSLLIFSSVIITGLSKAYADYTAGISSEKQVAREKEDLYLEIDLRKAEITQALRADDPTMDLRTTFNRMKKTGQCRFGEIEVTNIDDPNFIDLTLSESVRSSIRSIVYGSSPYAPAMQKYRNVNLAGLVIKLDQLHGDDLSKHRIVGKAEVDGLKHDYGNSAISSVHRLAHEKDGCMVAIELKGIDKYLTTRLAGAACVAGPKDTKYCPSPPASDGEQPH